MTVFWTILGVIGYFLIGIPLFIIIDVWRMTVTHTGYETTFKLNLLYILNGCITDEHFVFQILGFIFCPIGIIVCLLMAGWYCFDEKLLNRLRDWCRK